MKWFSILLLIFSFNTWSKVNLNIVLSTSNAKQGEIVQGKIIIGQSEGQAALSGLNGLNVQKTIYLINVSPFIGKNGNFEADAKVIFLKVPESTSLHETVNGEEITFNWTPIEIIPTEEPKSFLLGSFDIPSRQSITRWIIGVAGTVVLIIFVLFFLRWRKNKQKIKAEKNKLKKDLLSNETYTDIVTMWRQKQVYLEVFPVIADDFKEFEKVLFKYQFKQTQNESEIEEIISAYKTFCSKIRGSLDGI